MLSPLLLALLLCASGAAATATCAENPCTTNVTRQFEQCAAGCAWRPSFCTFRESCDHCLQCTPCGRYGTQTCPPGRYPACKNNMVEVELPSPANSSAHVHVCGCPAGSSRIGYSDFCASTAPTEGSDGGGLPPAPPDSLQYTPFEVHRFQRCPDECDGICQTERYCMQSTCRTCAECVQCGMSRSRPCEGVLAGCRNNLYPVPAANSTDKWVCGCQPPHVRGPSHNCVLAEGGPPVEPTPAEGEPPVEPPPAEGETPVEPPLPPSPPYVTTNATDYEDVVCTSQAANESLPGLITREPRLLSVQDWFQVIADTRELNLADTGNCSRLIDPIEVSACGLADYALDTISVYLWGCDGLHDGSNSTAGRRLTADTKWVTPTAGCQKASVEVWPYDPWTRRRARALGSEECCAQCPSCCLQPAYCSTFVQGTFCQALGMKAGQLAGLLSIELDPSIQPAEARQVEAVVANLVYSLCVEVFSANCNVSTGQCTTCQANNTGACSGACCCVTETGSRCGENPDGSNCCCCPEGEAPRGANCACVAASD